MAERKCSECGAVYQQCAFVIGWVGRCQKPAVEDGKCSEHAPLKCVCGRPASRSCEATLMLTFVCGMLLCEKCGHDYETGNHAPIEVLKQRAAAGGSGR